MYDRTKAISVAQGELGYREKASNAQLDDKTANSGSGNYTKYARDLDALGFFYNGPKQGQPYCDIGVDWTFVKAYGVEAALKLLCQPKYSAGAGCYYSAMYYKQMGQFYGPKTIPQVCDQIFFTYAVNEVSHTGLVEYVEGNTVHTIEFNSSDGVYRRSYPVGHSSIYGYGRPKWDMDGDSQQDQSTQTDSDDEITALAREVIAGKWGIGATRIAKLTAAGHSYAAVQARVNELLTGKAAADETPTTVQEPAPSPAMVGYALWLEEVAEGSSGNTVKAVQTLLIALGYRCGGDFVNGHEVADGDFGPTTRKAVEAFQKANGLTVNGTVDDKTMSALLK